MAVIQTRAQCFEYDEIPESMLVPLKGSYKRKGEIWKLEELQEKKGDMEIGERKRTRLI